MVLVVAFQNCGKAGFDESGGGGLDLESQTTDSRLSGAPFPYHVNLNHVSYMTCPAVGDVSRREPVDTQNPYYSVRAGAFDNLQYASVFGASGLTASEQSRRLNAGIGLKKEFFDFVTSKYAREDKEIMLKSLMQHPGVSNYRLTLALINEDRSRVEGGFGWDYTLFTPLAENLSSSVMSNYLINAPLAGATGTKKTHFFSGLDPSTRALVGSLSWGKVEADRNRLNSQLRSNLILTLGFMNDQMATDITQLQSPDADPFKSVHGRGYRMTFSDTSVDGLKAPSAHFVTDIEEMDMGVKPLKSVRAEEGQQWDCFALRVVRHIDRLDWVTNRPITRCRDPITQLYVEPAQRTGICNHRSPAGTAINGVKVICPVQTIDSMNTQVTESGVTYQKAMLRLQMARRVLPADLWEINTDPNYMCAVPTELATQRGKCYASGDEDSSKYIQYSLVGTQGTQSLPCGPGANECPAYVSICYRKY